MNVTPVSSPAAEFSAAQAVAAGTDFAELKVSADGLFWLEFRPADGACRIWHWLYCQARCLTPDGFSVRSRVYEYGGGSFCLGADGLVFVNEQDQQVYTQPLDDLEPRALTQNANCRYGDVQWHDGQVLAVEERHAGQVEHRLVALSDGGCEVLAEGADFYAAPTVSGDGQRLAWIEWDRPAQPWTVTRLMCRMRDASGHWLPAQCVAAAEESLQQPRFDGEGRLYCLSDRNGFWQPWGEVDGQWQAMPAEQADHAAAPWQLGTCTWLPLGPHSYLASWFENGFGQLGVRGADGRTERFASAYTRFRNLAIDSDHLYAIAASPISPPAVIAIDRSNHEVRVLAGGAEVLPADHVSLPQAFHYASDGEQAHGFFYPAARSQGAAPLVVFIHGGPTSACYPVLDPRIQYWTQRGFAVADLNYRGSTGYGRAYRQALHLRWGESDVADACAAVR
uniref:S9 family peptidase n=1 Tax=Pseudomonas sp. NBRC 111127 TaxID=1661042 RepID=UPI0006D3EDD4